MNIKTAVATLATVALPPFVSIPPSSAADPAPADQFQFPHLVPLKSEIEESPEGFGAQGADGKISAPLALGSPVNVLDAPWAVGANGLEVATHYEIRGASLVQIVDHSTQEGLAYPITADPSYSWGWGAYVHFNRAETKTIASMGFTAAVAGTACGVLGGMVGGPVGAGLAGTFCAAAGTAINYQAGLAQNSSPKKCLYMRAVGAPVVGAIVYPGAYRDNRCR